MASEHPSFPGNNKETILQQLSNNAKGISLVGAAVGGVLSLVNYVVTNSYEGLKKDIQGVKQEVTHSEKLNLKLEKLEGKMDTLHGLIVRAEDRFSKNAIEAFVQLIGKQPFTVNKVGDGSGDVDKK